MDGDYIFMKSFILACLIVGFVSIGFYNCQY